MRMYFFRNIFITFIFLFSQSSYATGIGESLSRIFSSSDDEVLHPDSAFKINLDVISNDKLLMNWQIEAGYYLYKDKFSINSNDSSLVLGDYVFPLGKLKDDLAFGEVEVYYGQNQLVIPFETTKENIRELNISVGYQGCKEGSICYPPIEKNYTVSIPNSFENIDSKLLLSEQDAITNKLKEKNLLLNVLSFFIFGFLLALTPCVFPMIPILSGIIVGEGIQITRTKATLLTLSYVFSMAATYAALGVIAGIFSFNLQAASQNIWAISLFSSIFVLLALSMFGFYELKLPNKWQSKLFGNKTSGNNSILGAAFMGVLSAIIVGPCVAPPLAGALLYISQTGDAQLGGLALFSMGLGFGVPLIIIGISSGELLPRAGAWMNSIKQVFGVLMLGVAIWFMERVLPASLVLILWSGLFIFSSVFLGVFERSGDKISSWDRLRKGLGLLILFYGLILLYASVSGGGTVLDPFNKKTMGSFKGETLPFVYVSDLSELDDQLSQSRLDGEIVMLDFYADWCIECKQMEAYTFSNSSVKDILKDVKLIKADVTENNNMDKALLKNFELFGPPAILFFDKQSNEIRSHRLIGFFKSREFIEHVKQLKSL